MDRPTIPIPGKHILVVEENPEDLAAITRTLEIEGYTVHQALDGQAALHVLQWTIPELILAAVEEPSLNGMSFYRAVRQNQRWITIPFVFLTSGTAPEVVRAGRELGVEDYLIKPIDGNELVNVVNSRMLRAAELQIAHIDQAYLETVNVLANTIEGRDPYTHGHVERVATYARWLAEALHWPASQLRMLEFGARLHDIGKIIVPDHILKKPGALTKEEWDLMKQHPIAGSKILRNISHLQDTVSYVMYHHERWDGSGYPQGTTGRETPLEGRLLAIADVYDALTSKRPYHPARPHREVVRFLKIRSGTHFDPDLVEIFIEVLEKRRRQADYK